MKNKDLYLEGLEVLEELEYEGYDTDESELDSHERESEINHSPCHTGGMPFQWGLLWWP